MPTWTALTLAPDAAAAEALAAAMEALAPAPDGIGTLEIEDGSRRWEVGGYFSARPDAAALAVLAAVHGARPFAVSELEDRDWVAQVRRELTPVRAGRFVVHGGHDAHRVGINDIGLRIEAAMAFGTGHHGTTRGCLLALDRLRRLGWNAVRVADIGCGTGVLAMAAAALWRSRVIATDIDPVAVATARENVRANGLSPWVRVGRAAGFRGGLVAGGAPYGLIFGNILARPLRGLAPDIAAHLAPGGAAILSGVLDRQAAGVEGVYRGWGFRVEARHRLGEWVTLTLRRG